MLEQGTGLIAIEGDNTLTIGDELKIELTGSRKKMSVRIVAHQNTANASDNELQWFWIISEKPNLNGPVVDSGGCGPGRDGKVVCTDDHRIWVSGDFPYDHSTCRTFFEVIWADEHIRPIGAYDYWPNDWHKWWRRQKTQKKYPGFCYEPNQHRPHYVIFWSEHTVQGTHYLSQQRQATTAISGDVSATATTTWWESVPVPYAATHIHVWMARSSDIAPALAADRDPTIYQSGPAEGKRGLEDVFKFIANQNSMSDKQKP